MSRADVPADGLTDGLSYDAYRAARRFPALDGLRALAVAAVVWHHAVEPAGRWGKMGVALFFAISGFLITTLLLRERDLTGRIDLGAFYARRSLRIFPLYYAVLALYVVLVTLAEPTSPAGREFYANLPSFATYTSNWFVEQRAGTRTIFYFAWTLATEEQFYLVWPAVVRAARDWRLPVGLALLLLAVEAVTQLAVDAGALTRTTAVRVALSPGPGICLGSIAAFAAHNPRVYAAVTGAFRGGLRRPAAALALLAAAFAGVVLGAPEHVLFVLFTLAVFAACVSSHPTGGWLGWAPLRVVGLVSYGVYLLHMLVLHVARQVLGAEAPPVALFVVTLLGATPVAVMSYYGFEMRFLRLRERFRPGRAGHTSATAAPHLVSPLVVRPPEAATLPR